jgi:hypothetical protein
MGTLSPCPWDLSRWRQNGCLVWAFNIVDEPRLLLESNRGSGRFVLIQPILLSQESRIEMSRRMEPSGQAFRMAEHLLIVPFLRWTVDASRVKERSGVWDYCLDRKAAKTTLIRHWRFFSLMRFSMLALVQGSWRRPEPFRPLGRRSGRIPALPYPPPR